MRTAKLPARCFGVLEKHVQQAVVEFLEFDNWRPVRTEHAIERNAKGGFKRRVGETGMPDYLFLRYCHSDAMNLAYVMLTDDLAISSRPEDDPIGRAICHALWIEFKRPGGKPRADQTTWHQAEAARGALVIVVDDFEDFRRWYQQSGLYRRQHT